MIKNTIYYRFSCENKKYKINFDTTEISIGDIKKEIIQRRNMSDKRPEDFKLIFYDEKKNEIKNDDYKVGPLTKLTIKRFPLYKFEDNKFIKDISDPNQIPLTKGIEFNRIRRNQYQLFNTSEPLEKIGYKLNLDILQEKFQCRICKKKKIMNINIYLLLLYVVMKQYVKTVMIKKKKKIVLFVKKKKKV